MTNQCVLSNVQKDLLRSLVPGLKARDGTVKTEWRIVYSERIMALMTGLSRDIWESAWNGKVTIADFHVFVACNLFIEKSDGHYILVEQAIIDLIESEPEKQSNVPSQHHFPEKDWDFFISHASEDKDAIARPLANELIARGFKVWYDEFSLKLGDKLRRSIERGLSLSKYGVVILSPSFFAKDWPQNELDGLFAREISERETIILPIWHNLNQAGVAKYSPILADRFAVSTAKGLEYIVNTIMQALPEEKASDEIEDNLSSKDTKWQRVATLFWLCHDLLELYRWLLSGISKEWIDIGLRQSTHHSKELGLSEHIVGKLQALIDEAAHLDEENWDAPNRERFARDIKVIFNQVAQLTQQRQQTIDIFDSGPG